jgi:hypothetical protein
MTAPTELLEHDTLPGRCRRSRFANRWTFPGARRGGKRLDESLISVTCLTVLHKQPLMALNHILEKRRCGILFRTSHSDRKSYNRKKKTRPGESLLHGILCGFRWAIGSAFPGLVWSSCSGMVPVWVAGKPAWRVGRLVEEQPWRGAPLHQQQGEVVAYRSLSVHLCNVPVFLGWDGEGFGSVMVVSGFKIQSPDFCCSQYSVIEFANHFCLHLQIDVICSAKYL